MRSAYRSELLWIVIACGLGMSAFGWLTSILELKLGGLMIAGLFGVSGLANFLGTRFPSNREFVRTLPSLLMVIVTVTAVVCFFTGLLLGHEGHDTGSYWVLAIGAGSIVLGVPAGFFARGMVPATDTDR